MIDMVLSNGDFKFNKYGDIALCPDEDNDIIQSINNNIVMRYGDNIYHTDLGNKIYDRRIKASQSSISTIISECSVAIMQDSRVQSIDNINVSIMDDRTYFVSYKLTKYDGSNLNGNTNINIFSVQEGDE